MPTPIRTTCHWGPILAAAVVLVADCQPEQTHQELGVILPTWGDTLFVAPLLIVDMARRQHLARGRASSRREAGARRRVWPGWRTPRQ